MGLEPDAAGGRALKRLARSLRLRVLLLLLAAVVGCGSSRSRVPATDADAADIELFWRAGCPHCAAAETFLDQLQRRRPALRVQRWQVDADGAARARLQAMAAARGLAVPGVPAIRVRDELLFGFDRPETTGARIVALLDRSPAAGDDTVRLPIAGELRASEVGLVLFTVAVGLVDGFNPCAMWVLLFLLSVLVGLRSRRRMAAIAGVFVLVSGAAYYAFMAAWLNLFLLLGLARAVQVILGIVALVMGAIHVKEFWAFRVGPSLSIPESVKPGIMARVRAIARSRNLALAITGAAILAVLVNAVELLCTAGLPALYTHVLAVRGVEGWHRYGYLLLYDAAYMLDDTVMVAIAVVTLGRHRLQEREGRWLKLVSGAVMMALAAVLLIRPDWLAALGR